jgi:hypothetical protein
MQGQSIIEKNGENDSTKGNSVLTDSQETATNELT